GRAPKCKIQAKRLRKSPPAARFCMLRGGLTIAPRIGTRRCRKGPPRRTYYRILDLNPRRSFRELRRGLERRSKASCYFLAIRASEAGACVPSDGGREVAIVAFRNVVQCRWVLVEGRIDEADRTALRGVDERYQAGPKRGHRTGSADDRILSIDSD